jgi:nitronate monooxygenase
MNTRLQSLLKIKHPIIQAPMAGSDSPKLAAAASNAGVLGSIGVQYMTPAAITSAITEIRSLTGNPFAVNLFSLSEREKPSTTKIAQVAANLAPYYEKFGVSQPDEQTIISGIDPEEQFEVIIKNKVPIFSFTLGMPTPDQIRRLKDNNIISIGTATNVREAKALMQAGIDAVCVQGSEAGGHRGTFIGVSEDSLIGCMALIPQVCDAIDLPVIAAGGIMDGRGIAAALSLGADGVQMGTAFLTTTESKVHPAYKKAIREQDVQDTALTRVFSGGMARGIKNKFMAENEGKPILSFPFHNAMTRPFRNQANQSGQIDYTNLWSGQAGALAKEIDVKTLVDELLRDTDARIKQLAQDFTFTSS